jgi:hypothetical protein
MIRFIVVLALLVNVGYAGGKKYFIKFGSFKDLRGLEKSVAKLPRSLRSHVIIIRSNRWYIPFAYYTANKRALYSKVSKYKRYFPDAHIAKSAYMLSHPIVRNYATKKTVKREYIPPVRTYVAPVRQHVSLSPVYQNTSIADLPLAVTIPMNASLPLEPVATLPVVEQPVIIQSAYVAPVEEEDVFKKKEPKRYKNFSTKMLSGQRYYLTYKASTKNPDLLIKISFGTHDVTYQPVMGNMQMTQASYLIEGDRLYMFANVFTRDGAFSKLEEHRKNHFLVSSWANGKKLNTLRYYYHLNDAKEYLGMATSTGLAKTLEEGDFDAFFLEED